MSSKAEIEAQIAALQARLREAITYDPLFTPTELLRWDPSLIGTMFSIQHELDIPRNSFEHTIFKNNHNQLFIWSRNAADRYNRGRVSSSHRLGMCGFLTPSGLLLRNKPYIRPDPIRENYPIHSGRIQVDRIVLNTFAAIATMNIGVVKVESIGPSHDHLERFYLKDLNCTSGYILPTGILEELSISLANPEKCLMDQLFVATYARFPAESSAYSSENDTILNKYPLSILYQEWKRDKAAGRLHRRTPLEEAMETIRALQAELRVAHTARTASEAHSDKLRAALHAAAENPV